MSIDSTNGNDETAWDEARRMLELELRKVRSEASAARLDARAAEIEWAVRRLQADQSSCNASSRPDQADDPETAKSPAIDTEDGNDAPIHVHRFASWNDVRSVMTTATAGIEPVRDRMARLDQPIVRCDDPHPNVARPRFFDSDDPATDDNDGDRSDQEELHIEEIHDAEEMQDNAEAEVAEPAIGVLAFGELEDQATDRSPEAAAIAFSEAVAFSKSIGDNVSSDVAAEPGKQKKPLALFASAVVHVAVLLLLGTVGLQVHEAKDQVALSASAASGEEVAMESFSIESIDQPEPETEITEPIPAETEYEVSPIGEFKASDFAVDAVVSPVSAIAKSMSQSITDESTATPMTLDTVSDSKMKFCGVEGGGNHFVYLVDSSGSMGDGFESARRELLASIDLLSPDQRFYVVFFDSKPDFMRISDPSVDESRSVYATADNKAALRRWAMRISKDRGKAPYDPLRFALELRADVIFLLSDGEFPEGIPKLLKEENRIENLFGETKPISIVHTIGYFSEEGASIMKRIASQNGGQYRHVPKP